MCYSLGHCSLLTAKCLLQVLSYILFCLFLIEYPVCLENCLITRGNINSNSHRLQMKLLQITFKSFFFGDLASTFLPKVNRCHKTIIEFHSFPWWSVWLSVMLVALTLFFVFAGPPWVPPVVAASQPSLLTHSYGMPQPPAYSQGVSIQSPVIGVTPAIQTPVPPHHPLMTAHFQLPPINLLNQSPYATNQPPITPSPLTTAGQVVHPAPQSLMGNGHMMHPLIQPPAMPSAALPLTNGQAMTQPASANQESLNGLQMLRTVGMGKYEFTDQSHPKGKRFP